MSWIENGWVCNLELKGDEFVEFKFVILGQDKSLIWEFGDNRIFQILEGGNFKLVCYWDMISEVLEFLFIEFEESQDLLEGLDDNGFVVIDNIVIELDVRISFFVE